MGGDSPSSLLCLLSSFHATLTAHLCWWWGRPNFGSQNEQNNLEFFLPPDFSTLLLFPPHLPNFHLFPTYLSCCCLWSFHQFLIYIRFPTTLLRGHCNCKQLSNQWCTFVCLCGACSPTKVAAVWGQRGLALVPLQSQPHPALPWALRGVQ